MKPLGARKDHRFDSDGQIKACRGRENNEENKLIQEQLNGEKVPIKLIPGRFYRTQNQTFCCYAIRGNTAFCVSIEIGYKWEYNLDGTFKSWKNEPYDFIEEVDSSVGFLKEHSSACKI